MNEHENFDLEKIAAKKIVDLVNEAVAMIQDSRPGREVDDGVVLSANLIAIKTILTILMVKIGYVESDETDQKEGENEV